MQLNDKVPDFRAESTKGPIQFYEWLGESWCLLFSHPADFTPVCTTELGRIAVHKPEFCKRNVKILAHSVDSLKSHVDWVNDIHSYCQDIKGDFPYPIIADPTRELAVKFGMIDATQQNNPEIAKTVRALFIISPDRRVRLTMHYPTSCGRNIDEILRCIDSLQLTDKYKIIATPANWKVNNENDQVMILPNADQKEIDEHFPNGIDIVAMPSGLSYIRTTKNYN